MRRLLRWLFCALGFRPRLLIRLGVGNKRRTAWESADPSIVCAVVFGRADGRGLDLNLSVYALRSPMLTVRANAEHAAHAGLSLQGGTHVDLGGLTSPPVCTPIKNCAFGFLGSAHREIRFASERELELAVAAVLATLDQRKFDTSKEEVRIYVASRWEAKDPEWTGFLGSCSASSDWGKLRRKLESPR